MENCADAGGGLRGLLAADVPGRSFAAATSDNGDRIEWYPAEADLALSADLGFTAGPWVCTPTRGGQTHGHFLTIWQRGAGCGWQVQFDRGVSHPAAVNLEPKLVAERAAPARVDLPPKFAADEAAGRAITDFQGAAREDGLAGALRTYARTGDFRFYTDQQAPMGLADANLYFTNHPRLGIYREDSRVRSADASLAYCAGEFIDMKQRSSHGYAQIWQYEPRVANWGLRVLLISAL